MVKKKQLTHLLIYGLVLLGVLEGLARIESHFDEKRRLSLPNPLKEATQLTEFGKKGLPYGEVEGGKLNKYGFKEDDDYLMEEKQHTYRILCLGDSITFGRYFPNHQVWPSILERELEKRGIDAEVINASFPGNKYHRIISVFENEYLGFKPDFVMIYKGFLSFVAESRNQIKRESLWYRLFKSSSLFQRWHHNPYLSKKRKLENYRKQYGLKKLIEQVDDKMLFRYKKQLMRLVRLSREHDFQLVVASYPHLKEESRIFEEAVSRALTFYPRVSVKAYVEGLPMFDEVARTMAAEEGFLYVPLAENVPGTTDYFKDFKHLKAKGMEKVAEVYADSITAWLKKGAS